MIGANTLALCAHINYAGAFVFTVHTWLPIILISTPLAIVFCIYFIMQIQLLQDVRKSKISGKDALF